MPTKPKSFVAELERLSAVESFKSYCKKYSPSSDALRKWSLEIGVDPPLIPKNFQKIRRQLGVAGKHGGHHHANRKEGVVRVRQGQFVRTFATAERRLS